MDEPRKPATEISESLDFQKNLILLVRQGQNQTTAPPARDPQRQLETLARHLAPHHAATTTPRS